MAAEETKTESAPKSNNTIVYILMGLNSLTMAGVVGVLMYVHNQEKQKEKMEDILNAHLQGRGVASEKKEEAKGGGGGHGGGHGGAAEAKPKSNLFELQPFVANLADPRVARYLRVQLQLEMDENIKEEELKRKTAEIRDVVLSILNSKRENEILSTQGKDFLKKEILSSVNESLSTGKVKAVLFTEFLVN